MLNRRRFIAGAGAAAAASGTVAALGTATPAAHAAPAATAGAIPTVRPGDPRYVDMVSGMNARLVGTPDAVRLPATTRQVVQVVREAVQADKRIVVRSGGHCFEDFVFNKEAQIIADLRLMNRVGYDEERRAFFVEPGATLLDIYETLHNGWGVTIPGGGCHSVGAGGHFAGGGYGVLSRAHGIVIDHVYAAEVVTVDRKGRVRAVVATREPDDPNRDLLWALAGGGGGNFGIVTKYWLRSRGAKGADPGRLLPRPPSRVIYTQVTWPWEQITEAGFTNLLREYSRWSKANASLDSEYLDLGHWLFLNHVSAGTLFMVAQIDADKPGAQRRMDDFVTFLSDAMGAEPNWHDSQNLPFMKATTYSTTGGETLNNPNLRTFHKSAFVKDVFPQRQIDALYKHLTRTDYHNTYSYIVLASAGGRINELSPTATPAPHRDAHLLMFYESYWHKADQDEANIAWLRDIYRDVYADTGGVPVPNEVTDGCYINYPDSDLSNPEFNRSSTPWHQLYYGENYARLQKVKAAWDPRNVFHHRQSVELPGR
ncbi:FAD-binding oxidoreductase [Streptomyces sp. NPDC047706]|uniref:FAD-binding oxidoreductase n=1 Tax=Streptomyces sp. NPDC047706 TaxID=3365486 RepID=UPI00371CDE11